MRAANPLLTFPPIHQILVQAAAAWALGQIGRHTPEHAKSVAQANVLPRLLQLYLNPESSEDLQAKVGVRIQHRVLCMPSLFCNRILACIGL